MYLSEGYVLNIYFFMFSFLDSPLSYFTDEKTDLESLNNLVAQSSVSSRVDN